MQLTIRTAFPVAIFGKTSETPNRNLRWRCIDAASLQAHKVRQNRMYGSTILGYAINIIEYDNLINSHKCN